MREAFDRASVHLPPALSNGVPLGMGNFGLVLAHPDNTVSKLFWRRDAEALQSYATAQSRQEIEALKILQGHSFGNVDTPCLVDELVFHDNEKFFAGYRMTRLTGQAMDWQDFAAKASPEKLDRHFSQVGQLLAQFHAVNALSTLDPPAPAEDFPWGNQVIQLASVDAETNKALQLCDEYLRANRKAAVNHGDFHAGNLLVDGDYNVTGLFDFSSVGMAPNHLMDFGNLPPEGLKTSARGYEEQGGLKVDPTLMTMTRISGNAAVIRWFDNHPEAESQASFARDNLAQNLASVRHITGFNPVF